MFNEHGQVTCSMPQFEAHLQQPDAFIKDKMMENFVCFSIFQCSGVDFIEVATSLICVPGSTIYIFYCKWYHLSCCQFFIFSLILILLLYGYYLYQMWLFSCINTINIVQCSLSCFFFFFFLIFLQSYDC